MRWPSTRDATYRVTARATRARKTRARVLGCRRLRVGSEGREPPNRPSKLYSCFPAVDALLAFSAEAIAAFSLGVALSIAS